MVALIHHGHKALTKLHHHVQGTVVDDIQTDELQVMVADHGLITQRAGVFLVVLEGMSEASAEAKVVSLAEVALSHTIVHHEVVDEVVVCKRHSTSPNLLTKTL